MNFLFQIPDLPAADNYPLIATIIIYTLVLLGAFGSLARYFLGLARDMSQDYVKALDKLVDQNENQTRLLLEIKEKVDDINADKNSRKTRNRRGL